MLNQSEPNLILTAHATKLNRPEPNWTEPQTCLAGRNHALKRSTRSTSDTKHESFRSYSDDRQPRATQTKVELRKSAKAVHA